MHWFVEPNSFDYDELNAEAYGNFIKNQTTLTNDIEYYDHLHSESDRHGGVLLNYDEVYVTMNIFKDHFGYNTKLDDKSRLPAAHVFVEDRYVFDQVRKELSENKFFQIQLNESGQKMPVKERKRTRVFRAIRNTFLRAAWLITGKPEDAEGKLRA